MASPFRLFRRYMKTLLVVFGVMIMFVFVVGDYLVSYVGDRGGPGNATRDGRAVAVRWDGGRLTNDELYDLTVRRRVVNQFLRQVEFLGGQAAFEAGIEPRPLRVERILRPETPEQGVEQSVVQTRLFAEAARRAGMRVSDDTIVQYLDELGRGNVSRDDMRQMLSRLQMGRWRVTIDYLIEALREEMLARNYIASHEFAFLTVTPQQRWEDWLTVNDRVVVEAAAIPVERFLVDVPEPTEEELTAFFDQHKQREPQPDFIGQLELPLPTPGFATPHKVDVQYIQASYDDFLAKTEGEITDQEVAQHYEQNKELFIKADTGLIEDVFDSEDAESADEAPMESPATDETGETPTSEAIEETSASDTDQTEEPAPPVDTGEAEPNEGDQSLRDGVSRSRPFRLAAFLQDAEADADSAAEAPVTDEPVTDEPVTDEPVTDEPVTDEPVTDEPVTEEPVTEEPVTDDAPADPSTASTPEGEEPAEYQPLEEVADVIRRELAERRAAEQLSQLVNQLASQLNAEFNKYFGDVLDAQAQEQEPPPPPPGLADLAPLAKEHGLAHGRTGPMSALEMRETAVGRSGSPDTGLVVLQALFGTRDLEMYQPMATVDVDGNRYVVMKTGETPRRVPALDEVRDEVVRAWKLQQAAELAHKHAEERAKKAEEEQSTLADFFADDPEVEVVRTDPFSHLTGGEVALVDRRLQQQPFRLSQPNGIVAAGPDFLRRVFDLKDDEVGAVLNHDHSIAYVVRIVQHLDSPDQLRTAYLAEASTWQGLRQMTSVHGQTALALLVEDFSVGAGLDWKRPADQPLDEDDAI